MMWPQKAQRNQQPQPQQLLKRKQLCRCSGSDGDQMSPNKCTRPQELQGGAAAALPSPHQPHITTPGNASRWNWLLRQGGSFSIQNEVTGTELMVTCPTTAEKPLEPQVGISLPCPNTSIHPPDLKIGRNKNREKSASLELRFRVKSAQAGLGNNWSVNEALAALLSPLISYYHFMSLNQFSYNCLRLQVEKTHYPSSPAVKNMGLCCISICSTAEALALFELWPGGCRFNCPHSSSCFKNKTIFQNHCIFRTLALEGSNLVPSNLKSWTKSSLALFLPAKNGLCVFIQAAKFHLETWIPRQLRKVWKPKRMDDC